MSLTSLPVALAKDGRFKSLLLAHTSDSFKGRSKRLVDSSIGALLTMIFLLSVSRTTFSHFYFSLVGILFLALVSLSVILTAHYTHFLIRHTNFRVTFTVPFTVIVFLFSTYLLLPHLPGSVLQ